MAGITVMTKITTRTPMLEIFTLTAIIAFVPLKKTC